MGQLDQERIQRVQNAMSHIVGDPEALPKFHATCDERDVVRADNERDALFQISVFVLGEVALPRGLKEHRDMLALIDTEAKFFLLNLMEVGVDNVPAGALGD